jgi:hypothetical protein
MDYRGLPNCCQLEKQAVNYTISIVAGIFRQAGNIADFDRQA